VNEECIIRSTLDYFYFLISLAKIAITWRFTIIGFDILLSGFEQ